MILKEHNRQQAVQMVLDAKGRMGRESISEFRNGSWSEDVSNTDSSQRQGNQCAIGSITKRANARQQGWWETEPNVGRVADGVAARVDRLKAIGNGQVPLVAATALEDLTS